MSSLFWMAFQCMNPPSFVTSPCTIETQAFWSDGYRLVLAVFGLISMFTSIQSHWMVPFTTLNSLWTCMFQICWVLTKYPTLNCLFLLLSIQMSWRLHFSDGVRAWNVSGTNRNPYNSPVLLHFSFGLFFWTDFKAGILHGRYLFLPVFPDRTLCYSDTFEVFFHKLFLQTCSRGHYVVIRYIQRRERRPDILFM